jgi:chromatin remodeling complex protein RSC6
MPARKSKSLKPKSSSSKNEMPVKSKVQESKTTKSRTKVKVEPIEPIEPIETVEPVENIEADISDVENTEDTSEKKKRTIPTKESIIIEFDELVSSIEEEIAKLRESSIKSKGVKYLRSLGKKVKTLRNHSVRVMKQKNRVNRKNNNNSGFLKPVQISEEMAKFTGWNPDDLKSRVDVTKYICKYIKDYDLQNPADRRQIRADPKLAKLLKYDSKKDDPLTYYRLQTYMKPHFIKNDDK